MKSKEYINYLKKLKRKKVFILSMQILILLLFVILWEVLSNKKIINPFLFSAPSKILTTIKQLYFNYHLITHILTTLEEIIIAFVLGMVLSFIMAILLYEFKTFNKIVDPYLTMLNSLPKVALGPLIIIIVGANTKSIIVMALLINLIVGIMSIYNGFNNVDSDLIMLFKTFKAIISSLKLNISMTLIGVIMGEFLVSQAGIGYLIIYGTQVFNLNMVMSGIVILIIISLMLYGIISFIEKKLVK